MFKFTFYEFFNSKRKCKEIKACSSYEGKTVTASAYLHPDDENNHEVGEKIAQLRCDQKLCKKKISRFKRKRKDIDTEIQYLKTYINTLEKRKDAYKKTIVETEERMYNDEKELSGLIESLNNK